MWKPQYDRQSIIMLQWERKEIFLVLGMHERATLRCVAQVHLGITDFAHGLLLTPMNGRIEGNAL